MTQNTQGRKKMFAPSWKDKSNRHKLSGTDGSAWKCVLYKFKGIKYRFQSSILYISKSRSNFISIYTSKIITYIHIPYI